jgi:hypothetical protein
MKSLYLFSILFLYTSTDTFGQSSACQSDSHRALDYWVGDWTVKNPQGQVVGENRIEVILGGCALLENWTGASASRGKSLNYYNAKEGVWEQKWIDNFGQPLEFKGEVMNSTIAYKGQSYSRQLEKEVMNEMTISKVSDDEVRQVWRVSSDEGESWRVVFDGTYLRQE